MKIEITEEFPGKASNAQIISTVRGARKLHALVMERSPELVQMLYSMRVYFRKTDDHYGPHFELALQGSDGSKLASYSTGWQFTKSKRPHVSPEAVVDLFTNGMYPVWKMLEEAVDRAEMKSDALCVEVAAQKKALEQIRK